VGTAYEPRARLPGIGILSMLADAMLVTSVRVAAAMLPAVPALAAAKAEAAAEFAADDVPAATVPAIVVPAVGIAIIGVFVAPGRDRSGAAARFAETDVVEREIIPKRICILVEKRQVRALGAIPPSPPAPR